MDPHTTVVELAVNMTHSARNIGEQFDLETFMGSPMVQAILHPEERPTAEVLWNLHQPEHVNDSNNA